MTKAVTFQHVLHLRAGVSDGDETRACFLLAEDLFHPLEEILLEDVRLQRATGFTRNDEEGLGQVNCLLDSLDLRRVGLVIQW